MKQRRVTLLLACLMCVWMGMSAQQQRLQYWFDSDAASPGQITDGHDDAFTFEVDAQSLSSGIHTLSIRIQDNAGNWSVPMTHYFLRTNPQLPQAHNIIQYEYWIDHDGGTAYRADADANGLLSFDLDADTLVEGIHTLSVRAKDDTGSWGTPITHYFLRTNPRLPQEHHIVQYEYWIDQQTAARQAAQGGETLSLTLDLDSLKAGIHTLTLRAQDNDGLWSSPMTHYFLHNEKLKDNKIIGMQYWFNDSIGHATYLRLDQPQDVVQIDRLIATQDLLTTLTRQTFTLVQTPDGNPRIGVKNVLNYRFKDATMGWGQVETDTFACVVDDKDFDLSFFITNPDADQRLTGWNTSGNVNVANTNDFDGNYFTLGSSSAGWQSEMRQTVSGLPAGTYRMVLQARLRGGSKGAVTVGDTQVDITQSGWETIVVPFITDGQPFCIVITGSSEQTDSWVDVDQFRLLTSNTAQMDVLFPQDVDMSLYQNMRLQLSSPQNSMVIVTTAGNRKYSFHGLSTNALYKLTLQNSHGQVVGEKNDIAIETGINQVVMDALCPLHNISLRLQPEGEATVTWTDIEGQDIGYGRTLTGVPQSESIVYNVLLNDSLGSIFHNPQPATIKVDASTANILCELQSIDKITICGRVLDEEGKALMGANVSVSQWLNGRIARTAVTRTGVDGRFSIEALDDSTRITIQADGYLDAIINTLSTDYGDIRLQSICGVQVSVDFTYITCEGETQNWYSDYNNVSYTLYNITKQQAISQFNVQYPQIVLLEEVEDGDELKLTATSRTNSFMPVEATATVVEQKAEAAFAIVELGKIQATFTKTGNVAVVGTLYDASGKLVKTDNYLNASLTISDLTDGQYTLVSMGSSQLFNTIYDLSQLPQTGLAEGSDYVKNTVEVKSGQIAAIGINEVPTLDESKLYYTGDNTSFTVNKPSIVAGNYLTLTGRIDFKQEYATNVSNVNLIVDIPESCNFVENSAMIGSNTSSYTLNGNRVTIPLMNYTDRVRFCVIPTAGGEYAPSAFAQFDLNGETITQPIGSANYTAKDLSINVPTTVAKTLVPISGTAIGKSTVEIYDGDVLIGQTTSLANGIWMTQIELDNPYHMTLHNIHADVTTADGILIHSESKIVRYNKTMIEVSKVTMLHDNPEVGKNYNIVFDFQKPDTKQQNYVYYIYNKKFTFLVELTDNDPQKVDNVIVNVETGKGRVVPLKAQYNESQRCWVAVGEFGNMYDGDLPVNVSVGLSQKPEMLIDDDLLDMHFANYHDAVVGVQAIKSKYDSIQNRIDDIYSMEEIDNYAVNGIFREMLLDLDCTPEEIDSISIVQNGNDGETIQDINSVYEQIKNATEKYNDIVPTNIYGEWENIVDGILVETTVKPIEYSEQQYADAGYVKMESTKGYGIYYRCDSLYQSFVDFHRQLVITTIWKDNKEDIRKVRKAPDMEKLLTEYWENIINKVPSTLFDATTDASFEYFKRRFIELMKKAAKEEAPAAKEVLKSYASTNCDIATCIYKWKTLIKNVGKLTEVLIQDAGAWRELNNQLDVIDHRMPESFDCAWMKYPDELQELYKNLFDYRQELGNSAARRMALNLGLELKNIWLQLFFDAAVDVTRDNMAKKSWQDIDTYIDAITAYNQACVEEERMKYFGQEEFRSITSDVHFDTDPSGFVYEGVPSNRLQDVTATCYYKEEYEDMYGDKHGRIVLWNAREHGQQNPLYTDENGFYRWDVPQGLWQVKFEKEGYETTYSEWLPVPPPQLDINIAMKQNVQPNVKAVRAYEDAVEVEFDKYMMPEQLNTDNIQVSQNGENVKGEVKLINEEATPDDESVKYASRVRFVPETTFTAEEVTLYVANRVKSYADIPMQDNYEQTLTIEKEVKEIVVDSLVKVPYEGTMTITVEVLPADASAGKTLNVKSSSPMILSVKNESIVIDEEGKAEITMNGELPGTAALTFTVEGTDKEALTIINVEKIKPVATPTASIASGSQVEAGTQIELFCTTEGATIYYTLDGSCPCVSSEARKVYDGTPITIEKNTVIKAMAAAPDMGESEVATFVYIVTNGDLNDDDKVDIADGVTVLNTMAEGKYDDFVDVNHDQKVDIADFVTILNIMAANDSFIHQ